MITGSILTSVKGCHAMVIRMDTIYDNGKLLVFLNANKKKIPLNKNSSLNASKNKGILQVTIVYELTGFVTENSMAFVRVVIIRIPKPRSTLNLNPFLVIPKSLN